MGGLVKGGMQIIQKAISISIMPLATKTQEKTYEKDINTIQERP